MKIGEIYALIEEERRKGIDKSKMTIHMSPDSYTELMNDSNLVRRPGLLNEDRISTIGGVEVVPSMNSEIVIETACENCDSDKLYHDRREEWVCPWCEDL